LRKSAILAGAFFEEKQILLKRKKSFFEIQPQKIFRLKKKLGLEI